MAAIASSCGGPSRIDGSEGETHSLEELERMLLASSCISRMDRLCFELKLESLQGELPFEELSEDSLSSLMPDSLLVCPESGDRYAIEIERESIVVLCGIPTHGAVSTEL
jgi:hypothetical protein